ncbi:MAG: phage terminase large subunit, partial [Thermoguttaceae bacterium]|nr:phage terminase large subunit [Thermoguttaceae bacterium]
FLQLATALHPEAIAMELASTPGWYTKIFPSIISFPERGDLWDEWKKIYLNIESKDSDRDARLFFDANKQEMLRGAKVLWEEKESLYDLMKMRVDGGERAFDREKQNIPQNPDFCEFPENYFSDSIWCDILPESFRYSAIAMDPSKGKNTNFGDYTALVFAGMDESGIIYIDANIARRPVHEIPEVSFNFYMCHKPDIFGVEVNQFQELLKDMLNQYFADNGISQVSVYPVTNHINKTVRIRRLGSLFSTERIRFYRKSSSNKLLMEQLKSFPTGEHDDGPDAMEMAIRLITMLQKSSDQRDVFSSGSFL